MLDSLDTLIAFVLIITVVSLLITIVVQMITSALNLRGKNVAWALAETFEAIEPKLAAQTKGLGKQLADHVLKDSLLSDVQFGPVVRPASAIRADELFDVLHRIATDKKAGTPTDIQNSVIRLFSALGVDKSVLERTGATVKEAQDVMQKLSTAVESIKDETAKTEVSKAFSEVSTKMTTLANNAANQMLTTVAGAEAAIQDAYQRFEHWFETGQDRARQWFTIHASMATAFFAIIFAFLLQLDTIEIFKTVSTNRAMRDKLVAQASGVLDQAGKILVDKNVVLTNALKNWTGGLKGDTKKAIDDAKLEVDANDTRGTLRQKVEKVLGASTDKADALKAFDAGVDTSAENELNTGAADYKLVKADLERTGFDLFPKNGWRWIDEKGNNHWCEHFFGMFFSILLLSLGAPFWFNILKSLASMRSSLVDNISSEQKEKKKKPDADKPGEPPPTVLPPQ